MAIVKIYLIIEKTPPMSARTTISRLPAGSFMWWNTVASPQLEQGYTRIANEIIESLISVKLTSHQFRIVFLILRETYGYKKRSREISLTKFAEYTKINRENICRNIKKLEKMGIILTKKEKKPRRTFYAFQKDYERWKTPPTKHLNL